MKPLFAITVALLAIACGDKNRDKSKRGVYINNINKTPIELFKEYPSCAGEERASDSTFYHLEQFLRGVPSAREVDMSASVSGRELKGFQIQQTYYQAEMMLEKRYKNRRLVGVEFFVTNEPETMSICPGVKSYQRYSYENAAMSAVHSIGKTVSKLRDVGYSAGRGVKVFISPLTTERRIFELEDRVVKEDYQLTDNAFYFPAMRAVVFMPQSEESRDGGGFGNVPLWEVPMVGSHEYGHHVFHNTMKNAVGELSSFHHSCFTRFEAQDPPKIRSVDAGDALSALNEGFADLISYYTLGDSERGLKGVVCMEDNREVGSPVFMNGDEKLFSENVMQAFLADYRIESSGCYTPDYQQIHTIGAVFASVAERLMSNMGHDKRDKLELVLSWLEDLNKYHQKYAGLGPERYLVKAYSLLAARSMEAANQPSAFECEETARFMPYSEHAEKELSVLGCR